MQPPLRRTLTDSSHASQFSLASNFKPPSDQADAIVIPALADPVYTMGTVAGVSREAGRENGLATAATFASPFGVMLDKRGSLLVSDGHNHCIRRVIRNATHEVQCLNVSSAVSQSITICLFDVGSCWDEFACGAVKPVPVHWRHYHV